VSTQFLSHFVGYIEFRNSNFGDGQRTDGRRQQLALLVFIVDGDDPVIASLAACFLLIALVVVGLANGNNILWLELGSL